MQCCATAIKCGELWQGLFYLHVHVRALTDGNERFIVSCTMGTRDMAGQ